MRRRWRKLRVRLTTTFADQENGLEFEFFLATKLKKTVSEMRNQMTNKEFMYWGIYWGRRAQERELEEAKMRDARG
jgi:hypothetical protein